MGIILCPESVSILQHVRRHHKPCLVAACPRWGVEDRPPQPGVGRGHHVHSHGPRFPVLVAVMDWFSRGAFPTRWRPISVWMRWPRPWPGTANRKFSTRTRVPDSRARHLRTCWNPTESESAWMAGAGIWTTCSWNACGGTLKYDEVVRDLAFADLPFIMSPNLKLGGIAYENIESVNQV